MISPPHWGRNFCCAHCACAPTRDACPCGLITSTLAPSGGDGISLSSSDANPRRVLLGPPSPSYIPFQPPGWNHLLPSPAPQSFGSHAAKRAVRHSARSWLSAMPLVPTRTSLSALQPYFQSLPVCRHGANHAEVVEPSPLSSQLLSRTLGVIHLAQLPSQLVRAGFTPLKTVKWWGYVWVDVLDQQQASQP